MKTVLTAKAINLMNGWTVVVIEPMLAWIEKVIGSIPGKTAGAIEATGGWTIGVTV